MLCISLLVRPSLQHRTAVEARELAPMWSEKLIVVLLEFDFENVNKNC